MKHFIFKMNYIKSLFLGLLLLSGLFFFNGTSLKAQPWTYDFGTGTGTANNTNAGSGKIDFFTSTPSGGGTYRVRIGTGGGSLILANPGTSLGTTTETQLNATTGTSTNKFGVYDWNSPSTTAYVKCKYRTTSSGNGNLNISFGINTIANDNQGYTSHYNNSLLSLTIAYTSGAISSVVRRISGSNTTISSHGFTKDGDQVIEIYANNGGSSVNYSRSGTSYSLATQTWDLWVDGTRVVTGAAKAGTLASGTNLSGFGFFAESSTSNAAWIYIDDLEYSNALPSTTAPSVTSSAASSIGTTSATFNGNVTSDGGSSITERGFVYKTSSGVTITDNKTTVSGTTGAYTLSPTLSINTRYYFKAYAINAIGTTLSTPELDFWTLANVPSAPTVNGATTSSLNVTVNANSNPSSTEFAIQETTGGLYVQGNGSLGASAVWQTASTWGTKTVTGLSASTTYTFKVKARNGANTETAFGSTANGTTSTPSTPTITVGSITAFGNQCINTTADKSYSVSGINLTADISITAPSGYQIKTGAGSWGSNVSLTPTGGTVSSTTIDVRFAPTAVQAYNGNITHTSTGATQQDVAISGSGISTAPSVTTVTASSITAIAASSGGNTVSVGCGTITAKGVVWNTSANPTIDTYLGKTNDGTGTADYVSSISGLSANTLYNYRAYSTNSNGLTSYGTNLTFTTLKNAPTTQASALTFASIGSTSMTISWTSGNGDKRVVKMNTTNSFTNPTDGTDPSANTAYGGSGEQVVYNNNSNSVSVTGLTASTTYWFRVYEYNNSSSNTKYITSTATDNPKSQATIAGPCWSENFSSITNGDNTTTGGSSTAWSGNSNFPTVSTAYQAGGAVRLGSGSSTGSITSTSLSGVSGDVTVSFDVKGWTTVEGSIKITLNGSNQTVSYTAVMSGSFETKSVVFTGVPSNSTLKIETTANRAFIDNVQLFCALGPEINLKGNSVSIANGDNTPSSGDHTDFGNTEATGGTVVRTFTIENTGSANLSLTGSSPYVSITGANSGDFSVTQIPTTPVSASSNTTFQITFDPSAIGVRTATLSIANDDSDENPYTFDIQGTGTNSNQSDIIENSGFSYSSNIDYKAYQSATISNISDGVSVSRFTIRDGGSGANDNDALGTELNSITFNVTNISNIRSAALFGGASQNTLINNAPSINTGLGTITFSGLSGSNLTASDNSTKDITLYVSFLSTVTDNTQSQYTISSASASSSGSVFSSANAGGASSSTTSDRNRIEVTADRLGYVQQPTNASINVAMLPAVTVEGKDVNNNRDLDFTGSVSITSTGTLSGSPVSISAINGLATFSSLTHTVLGTGVQLNATSSGLTSVSSSTFNIITIVYTEGDYRTIGTGSWANNSATPAIWQRYISGVWTASNSPSYSSTNSIYVETGNTITTGGILGNTFNLKIMEGGVFNCNHSATTASTYIYGGGTLNINANFTIASGGTFEVEDNGNVNINFAYGNPSTSIWQGTEIFHPNSNFTFIDWDAASDVLVPDNSTISTNTYNGYTAAFGNIICDFSSNLGASDDMIFLAGGVTINLCHGNLQFKTTSTGANMRIATTFSVTSGIGGDLIIDATMTEQIHVKTSGTMNFTIQGDFIQNGGDFRVFTSSTGSTSSTLEVVGDMIINGGIFYMSSTSTSNDAQTIVNLNGNLTVGSATLTNSNTNGLQYVKFNFTGTSIQEINITPSVTAIPFYVKANATAQLVSNNLQLNGTSSMTIENGGKLHFGWDDDGTTPLLITQPGSPTGTNSFTLDQGGYLYITHSQGINKNATNIGNVQLSVANKTFNQTATFHYVGKANQVTGDAVTTSASGKIIICDLTTNSTQLSLTNSTEITNATTISATGGKLDIRKGQLIETTSAYITGSSGTLYMGAGSLYKVVKGNSSFVTTDDIPRLAGSTYPYVLTGGTIELAGSGTSAFQRLRADNASFNYQNVKFSGANTYTTDFKNLSQQTTIDSALIITGTTVVDCITDVDGSASSFVGNGGLVMDGGRLRIKKFTDVNPELVGDNLAYNITGGTIEFYGTGAINQQKIRGYYTSASSNQPKVTYNNIEINASAANYRSDNIALAGNVDINSSFLLKGALTVNSPAVLRMDNTDIIEDASVPANSITINSGAGLLYGNQYGIKSSGTGVNDGNIRISGTRTFSTGASYGFVGSGNMETGNGLPASVTGLYIYKSNGTDKITLTNNLRAGSLLKMVSGNIATGSGRIELGVSTGSLGTLEYTSGYIVGNMRRWYSGTNSGTSSGLFPIGQEVSGSIYNRHYYIQFTNAPTAGGYLDVFFNTTPMGINGIPLTIPLTGSCPAFNIVNTTHQGYWEATPESGTLIDGAYTLALTGEDLKNSNGDNVITNLCQISLLKRVGSGNWTAPGTNIQTSGTTSLPTISRSGITGFSNFGFGGGEDNLLPVELLEFSAVCDNNNVKISWITASEKNNDYFTIEKSVNLKNWEIVGYEKGAGNSNTKKEYSLTDKTDINSDTYYRLKQTDYDGNFEYFNPVLVQCSNSGLLSRLQIYPIPAKDELICTFVNENTNVINIEIVDNFGKVVYSQKHETQIGLNEINILISQLVSGVYQLKISDNNYVIKTKTILIH